MSFKDLDKKEDKTTKSNLIFDPVPPEKSKRKYFFKGTMQEWKEYLGKTGFNTFNK